MGCQINLDPQLVYIGVECSINACPASIFGRGIQFSEQKFTSNTSMIFFPVIKVEGNCSAVASTALKEIPRKLKKQTRICFYYVKSLIENNFLMSSYDQLERAAFFLLDQNFVTNLFTFNDFRP